MSDVFESHDVILMLLLFLSFVLSWSNSLPLSLRVVVYFCKYVFMKHCPVLRVCKSPFVLCRVLEEEEAILERINKLALEEIVDPREKFQSKRFMFGPKNRFEHLYEQVGVHTYLCVLFFLVFLRYRLAISPHRCNEIAGPCASRTAPEEA